MKVEHVPNKHIKVTIPIDDDDEHDIIVKVKFYKHGENHLLAHFTRK